MKPLEVVPGVLVIQIQIQAVWENMIWCRIHRITPQIKLIEKSKRYHLTGLLTLELGDEPTGLSHRAWGAGGIIASSPRFWQIMQICPPHYYFIYFWIFRPSYGPEPMIDLDFDGCDDDVVGVVCCPRTTDTRRLNLKFFAAQIQISLPKKYLGVGYKGLGFL